MWLLGVVVRRYIDFLILLIPTPLVSVLFYSSIPTFCSFFIHNAMSSFTRKHNYCNEEEKFVSEFIYTDKKQNRTSVLNWYLAIIRMYT